MANLKATGKNRKSRKHPWASTSIFLISIAVFITSCSSGTALPLEVSSTLIPPTSSVTTVPPTTSPTETPTSSPVPPTPTSEQYQPATRPESIPATELTLKDLLSHGEWLLAQNHCKLNPAPKTHFRVDDINNDGKIFVLNSGKNDGTYDQARNSKICDLKKFAAESFGIDSQGEPLYLISQPTEDAKGNVAPFRFIVAQNGLDKMVQNEFFTAADKYPPRLVPLSRIDKSLRDQILISGKAGGPGDFRDFGEGTSFYGAQGTSPEEIAKFLQKIADQDGFTAEDIEFTKTHVFLGFPVYPPTSD